MFAPSPAPSFPPADALFAFLSNVDYKKVANNVITFAATFCAIVVAVSLFAYKNARAFWQNHGEEITLRFELFIEWLSEALEKVHAAGAASRPVVTRWANWAVDQAFYRLAAN